MGYNDEMTIDIKDLCVRLLLKWRLIIVIMLIMGALFNGIGIIRSYQHVKRIQQNIEMEQVLSDDDIKSAKEEELESLRVEAEQLANGLTYHEAKEAEMQADSYRLMLQSYEALQTNIRRSIKMQLDPDHVSKLQLQYYIDADDKVVYPIIHKKDVTADIITSYAEEAVSQAVCQKIAEELGWEADYAYIRELITAEGKNDSKTDDLLNIVIYAPGQDEAQAMADIIDKAIESRTAGLQSVFGEFSISELKRQVVEGADIDILNEQQSQNNALNTAKNNMYNMAGGLTDKEKEYYNKLLDIMYMERKLADNPEKEILEENLETEYIDETVDGGQEIVLPTISWVHKKYIAIGVFLGAMMVCGVYAIQYILQGRLRVASDLTECFNLVIFHTIPSELKKVWFIKKSGEYSDDERVKMICASIRISAKKTGMDKVYLTSSVKTVAVNDWMQRICVQLEKDHVQAKWGQSILHDPEAMEALATSDGVVLVEQVDCSYYEDIQREIESCNYSKVPIMGSVVIG